MQINSDWIKSEWILNVNILTWKHLLIKPWDLNFQKTSSCQCLLLNFDWKKNIFKKVYVWIIELISMNNIRYQLEQLEILTKNFSGTVNLALKLASLSMDCISIRFFSWFNFFVTLSFLNYYYYIQRYSYSIYKRTDLVVAVDKKVVCHMAATKQLFNQFSTVVKGKGLCWCSSLWSPITIHSHVWPT